MPAGIDALAGLELGGVPLATMMSQVTGLPARFVRKEAKTYGTCQLAEGGELDGHGCASSKTWSPRAARCSTPRSSSAHAARCSGPVVCVIDRESGGVEKLAAEGLELHALFTMTRAPSGADQRLRSASSTSRAASISSASGRGVRSAGCRRTSAHPAITQSACASAEPGLARGRRAATGVVAAGSRTGQQRADATITNAEP